MQHINIKFSDFNFSQYQQYMPRFIDAINSKRGIPGQFLNWIDLPQLQLERIDNIYRIATSVREQTSAKQLVVIGIGGSKHPIEHALSINGLNISGNDVLFCSDIDSVSINRLLHRIGNLRDAVYLVVSKSGTTFETTDAMFRIQKNLSAEYASHGFDAPETHASKHFIAVTDVNPEHSRLRQISDSDQWIGDLYIHEDVGGRFSAFDDHVLFALAFAGMTQDDMRTMLDAAAQMSNIALCDTLADNIAVQSALFWIVAAQQNISDFVHLYMGDVFSQTVLWHTQMQNESIKNTRMQIAKIPDAMHHSAEAHFNIANKYATAITMPIDNGVCAENATAYENAMVKSYSAIGPTMCEYVDTDVVGLTPAAAGAITQLRAFTTIYQEIIRLVLDDMPIPSPLASVLQPYVEIYKQNLKGGVVVPGRITGTGN